MDFDTLKASLHKATRDPYEFFGDEVEHQFRKLATHCHPDVAPKGQEEEYRAVFAKLTSLRDAAKLPMERIKSPQREYEVRSVLARGDLCDVLYCVDERGRPSFVKRPFVEVPAANNLLAKEREVLELLNEAAGDSTYARYLPSPVESFVLGKKRLNSFTWRDGLHETGEILDQHGRLHPKHIAWMFKRALTILGFVHQHKWTHAAVVPQHCLWHTESHGLVLCDWIHATPIGKDVSVVPANRKAWYPKQRTASPALDIWLAAKTVTEIAGGESQLPELMRGFLSSCYLPGKLAPQDAWEVSNQFTDLLDQMYGPPVFVPLAM